MLILEIAAGVMLGGIGLALLAFLVAIIYDGMQYHRQPIDQKWGR